MKVKQVSYLTSDEVRAVCCQHDYFTHGTNTEYQAMLKWVDNSLGGYCEEMDDYITPENLYKLAKEICVHSDLSDYSDVRQFLESCMYNLSKAANRAYMVIDKPGIYPVITKEIQKEFEEAINTLHVTPEIPMICGYKSGRACRKLDDPSGACTANCTTCSLAAYAKAKIDKGGEAK